MRSINCCGGISLKDNRKIVIIQNRFVKLALDKNM
jgi:hypothetical protein